MRIQYANKMIQNLGIGDSTTCVYQLIYDENDNDDKDIIQFWLCVDWYYA